MMMKENSLLKDIFDVLISVLVISFLLITFVIYPCQVDGDSMYPTLKNEQKGYSFIFTKYFGIERFDICILNVETEYDSKKIVKRVIGMPNETVEYKDNKLYINGEYVEEPFLDNTVTEDLKIVLGEDEYFCLGDNRSNSRDSRYYGTFSKSDFKATNFLIASPIKELGFVQ